jgi:hypothetical protein
LKKEWVAKQKIKSKWKAQKRRDSIVTQRDLQKKPSEIVEEGQHSSESVQKEPVQRQDTPSGGPSLRELQRQAYSPASLHHYKSHPLHRSHKAEISGNDRRGGGQPDMRKRMSAMLEKIKRDYT